jgi:hypothetical protein
MSKLLHKTLQELLKIPAVYTSEQAAALINETLAKYDSEQVPEAESSLRKVVRDAAAVEEGLVEYVLCHRPVGERNCAKSRTEIVGVALKWEKTHVPPEKLGEYWVRIWIWRNSEEVADLPLVTFVGILS